MKPLLYAVRLATRRWSKVSPLGVYHSRDRRSATRRHVRHLPLRNQLPLGQRQPLTSLPSPWQPGPTPCVHLLSSSSEREEGEIRQLDHLSYHRLADETLDELAAFFEDLGDSGLCSKDYDASLAGGVLNVNFGDEVGTYVINKQSPNKQIWLSSPKSGPKRYDIIDGQWRYSHDGVPLHDLLTNEISEILGTTVDFNELHHARISTDDSNWA